MTFKTRTGKLYERCRECGSKNITVEIDGLKSEGKDERNYTIMLYSDLVICRCCNAKYDINLPKGKWRSKMAERNRNDN